MDIVSGQEEAFLTQLHAQLSSTLANFPFTSVTANLKVQDTFSKYIIMQIETPLVTDAGAQESVLGRRLEGLLHE